MPASQLFLILSRFAFNCAVEMVSHGPQCYSYCGSMGNLLSHLKNLLLICNATVFVYFKTVNKLISPCIHFSVVFIFI